MTYIEGVHVENPTAVWMQLKNTRHNVLKDKDKWNPGGWFEQHSDRQNPFTMCLANAVRFVARGSVAKPGTYSYDTGPGDDALEAAERIILRAIPAVMRSDEYEEIPAFNDASDRKFEQIVKVLDKAIEMVAPYAKADVVTFADDVMTKEEFAEIRKATWEAEEAMWDEYRVKFGVKFTEGKWRTAKGMYAKLPPRKPVMPVMPESAWVARPLSQKEEQVGEFRLWLDDHEKRGWDTFWDDLLDCDKKDPEYEACQAARKALGATKPAKKAKTKVLA